MDARPNIRDDSARTFLIIIHRLITIPTETEFQKPRFLTKNLKGRRNTHTCASTRYVVSHTAGVKVTNDVSLLSRFIEITYMQQNFLTLNPIKLRVCEGIRGYAKVYAGMRMYARVYEGMRG
jgi:hypothetical protein